MAHWETVQGQNLGALVVEAQKLTDERTRDHFFNKLYGLFCSLLTESLILDNQESANRAIELLDHIEKANRFAIKAPNLMTRNAIEQSNSACI